MIERALIDLRDALASLELGLELPSAPAARHARDEVVAQVDDYLLPRLRRMDAPLLMVVGGSTGAGKSMLVNSLVGTTVSPSGVLRPTTRAPVLACHPDDVGWFEDDRILPGLSRTTGAGATDGSAGLQLVPTERLPPGLALLDSPDIDSVVEANRLLAGQLLAAADSWLFVTTAARYADAVPWDLLHAARDRGTAISLVLNRVPPEAAEVAGHLQAMLAERGPEGTQLLVVEETVTHDGLLPTEALAPVRGWLDALADDAQARAGLVRRTLEGALDSLGPRVRTVEAAAAEQRQAAAELDEALDRVYADAVPWDLLHAARDRGTALSLVLNRVPPEAAEVAGHLQAMLAERGLEGTQLLVVEETVTRDGLLPTEALAPVRGWLDALADDAQARAGLVRRTLEGALDSLGPRVRSVETAATEQRDAAGDLDEALARVYADAHDEVDEAVRSGALLRGEVLARWHEVVGTGDLMRALEGRISWVRDRLRAAFSGGGGVDAEIEGAVLTGVEAVVHAAADRAAERAAGAWRGHPAGRELLAGAPRIDAVSSSLREATAEEVRGWQGYVFDLVREEGAGKRTTARLASLGVNGAGLTVMLAVFASTGGLTGAEIVVAGGTSAAGQKLLEAIFGDQAVRTLAARARTDLLARVDRLLAAEAERYRALLADAAPGAEAPERLSAALGELERAR